MKKKIYSSNEEQLSIVCYYYITLRLKFNKLLNKNNPHKSFRLTKRRDYKRPLKLPGKLSFTSSVFIMIFKHKKVFLSLISIMMISSILLVGLMDQDFLTNLKETLDDTSSSLLSDGLGDLGKSGVLLVSTLSSGGLVFSPTESQQILIFIIFILSWLSTVWLTRNIMAGRKVKLRDGLYNCGSPIGAFGIIIFIIVLQLIPAFIAVIIYNAAVSTGFLNGGVETMAVVASVLLMVALSIYWVVGSFFALILSTLPGMYPINAINIARQMVIGRRMKILVRIIWCALICVFMWIPTLLIMLITNWLGNQFDFINNIPIIQFFMLLTTCFSFVFISVYTYMLYREVVKNDEN